MPLGVRERILAIRLMDKVNGNPAAAEKLGIVAVNDFVDLVAQQKAEAEKFKTKCLDNGR